MNPIATLPTEVLQPEAAYPYWRTITKFRLFFYHAATREYYFFKRLRITQVLSSDAEMGDFYEPDTWRTMRVETVESGVRQKQESIFKVTLQTSLNQKNNLYPLEQDEIEC